MTPILTLVQHRLLFDVRPHPTVEHTPPQESNIEPRRGPTLALIDHDHDYESNILSMELQQVIKAPQSRSVVKLGN